MHAGKDGAGGMALRSKSIDEETSELADIYDGLIAPKRIWRNHNNKLYLILRAYAAGKIGLNDAALALRSRFDPLNCEDIDLYATAKLVGTDFKQGAGSLLRITVFNKDTEEQKVFAAGVYNYQSASGMVFSFEAASDYAFSPEESKVVSAISQVKGSYEAGDNADIKLYRSDGAAVDKAFVFSCESNAGQLGYPDEDAFDFRTRVLNDADRQDHLKELELAVRNLPNIFECSLMFNGGTEPAEYDGITLLPRELLVTITGAPTGRIAELVAEHVCYATHKINDEQVVYYEHPLYIGGKYPVYFKYHDTVDFSLAVTYQYDSTKLKPAQVEDAVNALFKPYTRMVTHIDVFSEEAAYKVLSALNLPNVKILDADVIDAGGGDAPYIRIPATRLPHLTGVVFTAVDIGAAV
jgi:hypothetical protein